MVCSCLLQNQVRLTVAVYILARFQQCRFWIGLTIDKRRLDIQTEKSLTLPLYSLSKAVKWKDKIASLATFWMVSWPTKDVPYPNFATRPSVSEPETVPILILATKGGWRYMSTISPFVWLSYEMSSWTGESVPTLREWATRYYYLQGTNAIFEQLKPSVKPLVNAINIVYAFYIATLATMR